MKKILFFFFAQFCHCIYLLYWIYVISFDYYIYYFYTWYLLVIACTLFPFFMWFVVVVAFYWCLPVLAYWLWLDELWLYDYLKTYIINRFYQKERKKWRMTTERERDGKEYVYFVNGNCNFIKWYGRESDLILVSNSFSVRFELDYLMQFLPFRSHFVRSQNIHKGAISRHRTESEIAQNFWYYLSICLSIWYIYPPIYLSSSLSRYLFRSQLMIPFHFSLSLSHSLCRSFYCICHAFIKSKLYLAYTGAYIRRMRVRKRDAGTRGLFCYWKCLNFNVCIQTYFQ